MARSSKRAVANILLFAAGVVLLLLLCSAIVAVVRLGFGPAVNQLTWLHKVGITFGAILVALVCLDLVFHSITKKFFPHLVSESPQAERYAAQIFDDLRKEDQMRVEVQTWLYASSVSGSRLLDWIERDSSLLSISPEQEFVNLVRRIPANDDGVAPTVRLAECLRTTLMDVSELQKRPPLVVAKLFRLCAEVERPEVLGQPLLALLGYLKKLDGIPDVWTEEVRSALRSALIFNQIDDQLVKIWKNLVAGGSDSVLLQSRLAGWRGLSRIPTGSNTIGNPNFTTIGFGLKEMSSYWSNAHERRLRFQELVEQVEEDYSEHNVNRALIIEADRQNWEGWAVSCLKLYEETATIEDGGVRAYVWHSILDCLPESYYRNRVPLCSGEVFEVEIPKDQVDFVRRVANEFSPVWRFPYDSEKSVRGLISDVLAEITEQLTAQRDSYKVRDSSEKARAIDSAHHRALRSALGAGDLFNRPAQLAQVV